VTTVNSGGKALRIPTSGASICSDSTGFVNAGFWTQKVRTIQKTQTMMMAVPIAHETTIRIKTPEGPSHDVYVYAEYLKVRS
jgi:hypothetical protein